MKTHIPEFYQAAAAHIALQSVTALRVRFDAATVARHFDRIRVAAYERACARIARKIGPR
jgi:hypothetical protein